MEGKKANETPVIVGLGNPGEEYENTFHNVGKKFVDFLAGGEGSWKKAKNFHHLKGDGVVLVKPDVFMNESGKTVKNILAYFKSGPEQLVLVHDDSDLPLGEFKIQKGRGAAGHRGVASAMEHLGTKNFWRIRIGIRPENEMRRKKAGDFVLKKIGRSAEAKLAETFKKIRSAAGINFPSPQR